MTHGGIVETNSAPLKNTDSGLNIIEKCKERYQDEFTKDRNDEQNSYDTHSSSNSFNNKNNSLEDNLLRLNESTSELYAKQSLGLSDCLVEKTYQHLHQKIQGSDYNFRLNLSATNNNHDLTGDFDAIVPLWRNTNDSQVLFLQPGFILSIHSQSRSSVDGSVGIVYRFAFSHGILGVNVFYDRSHVFRSDENRAFDLERGSVGLDYQNGQTYISTNLYFPLTGWVNVNEYYKERALGGLDLRFKRLLTEKIVLHLGLSYWDYNESEDSLNSSIGLEYKINCRTSLLTNIEYDFPRDEWQGLLKLQFKFGGKKQNPRTCLKRQFNQDPNIWAAVEREKRIRYERARRSPQLIVPDQEAEEGIEFSYTISEENFRHVKGGELPIITINSLPSWMNYEPELMKFSGVPNEIGIYKVSGTISLTESSKASNWAFLVTVTKDSTPLTLNLKNQTVEAGESLFYEISYEEIINLRDDELFAIEVTSKELPIRYNEDRMAFISSPLYQVGTYSIRGTVSDTNNNTDEWSFSLKVQDTIAPKLSIREQRVEIGNSFSYTVQNSDINDLRSEETYTITLIDNDGSGIIYNEGTNTFKGNISTSTQRTYNIRGTIKDNNQQQSNWDFDLQVTDSTAPTLTINTQSVEAGNPFSYVINENNDISNIRSGETYTITISNNDGSGVTYNAPNKTFSANTNSLTPKTYNIRGTIKDNNQQQSNWNFNLQVTDSTAPTLTINTQTVEAGNAFSYVINENNDIGNIRGGETYTITVTDDNNSGVTYNGITNTLSADTSSLTSGTYTISGTISDNNQQQSNWSFNLNVSQAIQTVDTTAPQLNIDNQTIGESQNFLYEVQSSDLSHLRAGEGYTINITDNDSSGVIYDSGSETFSALTFILSPGTYTIRGTIQDNQNPPNLSNWSFNLIHNDAPELKIDHQSIDLGETFSYNIQSSDITGIESGETATISMSSNGGSGVTYSNNTFSGTTAFTQIASYIIQGQISDGTDTRSWLFRLQVGMSFNNVSMRALLGQTTLTVTEGDGTKEIEVIVETKEDRVPSSFGLTLTTQATTPNPASAINDFSPLSEIISFSPQDFYSYTNSNGDRRYKANKFITLQILNDSIAEENEHLNLNLERLPTAPGTIEFTHGSKTVSSVTIVDDDN